MLPALFSIESWWVCVFKQYIFVTACICTHQIFYDDLHISDIKFENSSKALEQLGLVVGIILPSLWLVAAGVLASVFYGRHVVGATSVIVFVGNILPSPLCVISVSAFTELAYFVAVARDVLVVEASALAAGDAASYQVMSSSIDA